ncbi:MAG TPA: N-acetylmuramoyl-L-alanine amidase [Clostridiales bacterium]|nr:N-acetylmuramoyl-L-alanine amidase [Clostridiales bacterium]
MPKIYLSPSSKESDSWLIGGNDEYYMNLIVDAMILVFRSNGIDFIRNNPGNSLSQIISQSNAGNHDLHIALYSNSSPENMRGILQGPDIYHYATSKEGQKAAEIIAEKIRSIYPNPELVQVIPTTILAELRRTKAPAILVKIAYQDNYDDAVWVRDNIDSIGRQLAIGTAEYLNVPFKSP